MHTARLCMERRRRQRPRCEAARLLVWIGGSSTPSIWAFSELRADHDSQPSHATAEHAQGGAPRRSGGPRAQRREKKKARAFGAACGITLGGGPRRRALLFR